MIDQLRLFSKLLKSIKRRTIKIEKRKLYSNQCDTMMMKVKNDESRLTKILYVSNLEINLLFARRFIKCELKENFNNDDLYMHIKKSIETLKVSTRDDIYIVDKIALELNQFAYMSSSSKDQIALDNQSMFVVATSNLKKMKKSFSISKSQQLIVSNFMSMFQNLLESQQFKFNNETSKKRDLYTL